MGTPHLGTDHCSIQRSRSAWTRLLDGPLASRAIETVRAIGEALEVPPPCRLAGTDEDRAIEDASLAGGRAGLAILYAYLARAGLADGAAERPAEFLEDASDAVAELPMPPSLYGGFTGVAWTIAHLHDSTEPDDDLDGEIDEALRMYLTRSPWTEDYDLVSGLAGIGVYALERLPSPGAHDLLTLVVDRLDDIAERSRMGVTWFTRPELLPDWQRQICPHGYYNLGLAHGVPGAIAVLAAACAAGVARSKARPLLDGAVTWLLSQKLVGETGYVFPSWIAPGAEPRPGKLAWCYGDPGIAASLLAAARAVGVPSWEREALDIARRAAARPPEVAGARDGAICHGSAGLAHLFNRMYQTTRDARLAEAARFWFTRALDMRQPGKGIAGYEAYGDVDGTPHRLAEPGLLTGAAGIALALLAAVSPIEPAWDRMLLVSLPSASPS